MPCDARPGSHIGCGGGRFTERVITNCRYHDSVTGLNVKADLKDAFIPSLLPGV